jgi:hypothetical protein
MVKTDKGSNFVVKKKKKTIVEVSGTQIDLIRKGI